MHVCDLLALQNSDRHVRDSTGQTETGFHNETFSAEMVSELHEGIMFLL